MRSIARGQHPKNLKGLSKLVHSRGGKIAGFFLTVIFTAIMLAFSIAIWQFMATTPWCQQRGTCLLHPNRGPTTTEVYPQSMSDMGPGQR